MRLSRRITTKAAVAVVCVVGLVLLLTQPAGAAATIDVTPSSGLTDGAVVIVTGSGFSPGLGGVTQCNDDPNQPTVDLLPGFPVPVGCANPLGTQITVTAGGEVPAGTSFTVHTGVIGPPAAGIDSAGHPAADDAALYPCPPTQAQIDAGVSCVVAVGDLGGNRGTKAITFQGQPGPSTTTTTGAAVTTTTAKPATTTTTAPATTTTAARVTTTTTAAAGAGTTTTTAPAQVLGVQTTRGDTLPATGPTRALFLLGLLGLVILDLGYLAESATHRPRQVITRIRSWARREVMRRG